MADPSRGPCLHRPGDARASPHREPAAAPGRRTGGVRRHCSRSPTATSSIAGSGACRPSSGRSSSCTTSSGMRRPRSPRRSGSRPAPPDHDSTTPTAPCVPHSKRTPASSRRRVVRHDARTRYRTAPRHLVQRRSHGDPRPRHRHGRGPDRAPAPAARVAPHLEAPSLERLPQAARPRGGDHPRCLPRVQPRRRVQDHLRRRRAEPHSFGDTEPRRPSPTPTPAASSSPLASSAAYACDPDRTCSGLLPAGDHTSGSFSVPFTLHHAGGLGEPRGHRPRLQDGHGRRDHGADPRHVEDRDRRAECGVRPDREGGCRALRPGHRRLSAARIPGSTRPIRCRSRWAATRASRSTSPSPRRGRRPALRSTPGPHRPAADRHRRARGADRRLHRRSCACAGTSST